MQDNTYKEKQVNNEKISVSEQALIDYGRKILLHEAQALSGLANELNGPFSAAAHAILNIPSAGRLVLSGIGKTGFVGMKISATFASIGIPSFFLHPAEAVHGDLGRVTAADVTMLLSNSGETPEILRLISGLKKIGCYLIALTGNPESLLARRCDLVLPLGKTTEVGPLGLAPTTSTTAMLALGDALAMTVSNFRPITREQFAVFHPGGNLGRTLLAVADVMRKDEELCIVQENLTARDVVQRITETKGRPGAAAIVDNAGILSGVFTDGDLRRLLGKRENFLDRPVSEVMGRSPKTVTPNVLADEALKLLSQFQIDQVIVINEARRPIGMVDIQDLIRWNTNGIAAVDY